METTTPSGGVFLIKLNNFIKKEYHNYFITVCQEKKEPAFTGSLFAMYGESVVLHPFLDLGLRHSLNILSRILGGLAANAVHEVQTCGRLEQIFLTAGGIAQSAGGELLDQGSGLSVILLLEDNILNRLNIF